MNAGISAGSLGLLATVMCLSAFSQDAKKGDKDDKVHKVDIKNVQASSLDGRVVLTPSGNSIVIQIPYQQVESSKNNGNGNNNNRTNSKPRGGSSSGANRAQQIQKQQIQAQIQQLRSMRVVTHWNEVEIPVTEKTKFRFNQPSQAFDDKGNVKRYTSEELKALKGVDSKLPGYEAKTSEIEPGHLVRVSLVKSADKKDPKPVASMVMVIGKDENYKGSGNSGSEEKKKK